MVTGDVFCLGLARHKVGKKARAAWMWTFGIVEVQTRQRVLENGRRFPGGAYGASIATLLQKAEFELEDFQDVTFVVRHRHLQEWLPCGYARSPLPSAASLL